VKYFIIKLYYEILIKIYKIKIFLKKGRINVLKEENQSLKNKINSKDFIK